MDNPSVSRFRDNYIDKTKTYNIKPEVARWYVSHAEQYIKAYPNQRLGSHTPLEIEQCLRGKAEIRAWKTVSDPVAC